LIDDIINNLSDLTSRVFWFTFFKSQKSAPADEFFECIRQLCEINKVQEFYINKSSEFEMIMAQVDFVISIEAHADLISRIISDFISYSMEQTGYCALQHQLKMYQT